MQFTGERVVISPCGRPSFEACGILRRRGITLFQNSSISNSPGFRQAVRSVSYEADLDHGLSVDDQVVFKNKKFKIKSVIDVNDCSTSYGLHLIDCEDHSIGISF
jgi:hypothetical protein